MSNKTYKIALIPGDGIGHEVVPAAAQVLERVGGQHGFSFEWAEFDWSCERYTKLGAMMPQDGPEQLAAFDGIFLGAVGYPGVADHISLWGLLIPIRRAFDQYANVRPLKLFEGVNSPLAGRGAGDIDMVIFRENTEGEYAPVGGRLYPGTDHETVVQTNMFTRRGTERIIRAAFEYCVRRDKRKKVTSVTKSNAQSFGMVFWDEVFTDVAADFPQIETESLLVDRAAMDLVRWPEDFDVMVASNLFADILSDIAAVVTGSMGLAPSANINPEKEYPSLFEPVHGAAFDIMGKGIANPLATVSAVAMMLDHLGEKEAAERVDKAVARCLEQRTILTADLGGTASTSEMGDETARLIREG